MPIASFALDDFTLGPEFEAAININGPVAVTLGPQGGFRHVRVSLEYDGHPQEVEICDRSLWVDCLELIACKNAKQIQTVKLAPKPRKKSQG